MSKPTVYVVYNDKRKDMSKAEKFGELKDVFSSTGRTFNGEVLIEHARHVLSKAKEGDYLLIVGDPALCGICMVAMADQLGTFDILRWDRDNFQYLASTLNFYTED